MIIKTGSKVRGSYYGVPFSGAVTDGRCHSMSYAYMYFVKLDAPISVFGLERDAIVVEVGAADSFPASIEVAA